MLEKILLVESDVDSRGKFYDIFSSSGHMITCVPNGKETMRLLRDERFKLIIVDYYIKDVKAADLISEIRKFDRDVSIVLLVKAEDSKINVHDGVTEVLVKDFSSHLMLKTIFALLKRKEIIVDAPVSQEPKSLVLVVDDNHDIRVSLSSFLEKKGYEVISAGSGEEAIIEVKNKMPSVVLLDVRMPGMDGLVVLRHIKTISKKTIVIMLTAAEEDDIMEEAKKIGATDYLTKPCDLDFLESTISSALAIRNI
jgi:DNA-binding response OmpR family regulator